MKRLIFTTLTLTILSTGSVFAADNAKTVSTFESVTDTYSANHICKQLGTKVCHSEDCTVGFGNVQKPTVITTVITTCNPIWQTTTSAATTKATTTEATTETTTKATTQATTQATTKPAIQTTTQATTKVTTEATTETTTKNISTETTTKTTTTKPVTTETTTKKETTTETTTAAANQQTGSYAQQVLNLVNAERAKYNLSPLTLSSNVNKVAQAKAEDMKNNNYFSHTSPTYGSPFDMLKQFGVSYKTAGENIAKGQKTPQAVVNAWMNSEGHRSNILNKNFTQLGVGYTGGSSPYWVQIFIG